MGNGYYKKQPPEKEAKINTYNSLFEVIANIPDIKNDEDKNSREFISLVARHCNYAGFSRKKAAGFICQTYKLNSSIVSPIVIETYAEYTDEFGSKSLMYNLKFYNKFDDEDWQKLPCIPQEVYDRLPKIFQRATEKFESRKRDILLTGLLGVTSGMLYTRGNYMGDTTFPNLFCFVVASPASGKGVLKYAKAIGIKREVNISGIDVFIPANISAPVIYKRLSDNGGVGIFFESEADTLNNTLKQDWGDFNDLLRKAFHFEEASLLRKDRYYKIHHPRLSVILSGTLSQLQRLIPDVENGLFSRFVFYAFKSAEHWDKEADMAGYSFDDYFGELSEQFDLIISNSMFLDKFSLTKEQKEVLHSRFEKWLNEFLVYYDDEATSIVKRLANITFRIAMILTAIRFGEQEKPTETPLMFCSDEDFETAFLLAQTYKHHSLFVYATLKKKPENKKPIDTMVQMFFEALPFEFKKEEANVIGAREGIGIAKRTVSKYLEKLVKAGHLEQPKYGKYRKSRIGKVQEEQPSE